MHPDVRKRSVHRPGCALLNLKVILDDEDGATAVTTVLKVEGEIANRYGHAEVAVTKISGGLAHMGNRRPTSRWSLVSARGSHRISALA